jgi:glucokinase
LDSITGLEEINPNAVIRHEEGDSRPNRAWIAVRRGLGEALLYWDRLDSKYRPVSSEGVHTHFAPRNDLEIELLQYLRSKQVGKPVTYSRILSREGLVNLYNFLRDTKHTGETAAVKDQLSKTNDGAEVIINVALANPSDNNNLCTQALDLFVQILGAEAGNLAMRFMALGGIYVGGTIAPKILDKLRDGAFMTAFLDKEEKFVELVKSIPVRVVTDPDIRLRGAAQRAAKKELMGKIYYDECTNR